MRVLLVIQHTYYFRALDPVVRSLHARGHEVSVLHGGAPQKRYSQVQMDRGLEVCRAELEGVNVAFRGVNVEGWHALMSAGRQVINRSIYLRSEHPSPHRGEALERHLPPLAQSLISYRWFRQVVRRPAAQSVWRWIEAASPPSPAIVDQLDAYRPDVMIVSPCVWGKDPSEADYLHAARARGIPTAGFVASWDNLTSKGTIHVIPDVLMLWNQPLAEEAVMLHKVPRQVIRIVGAPYIDHFFTLRQTEIRSQICERIGCPADTDYVLYFCTSPTLIGSELKIVTEIADALDRRCADHRVKLVVRPHPSNATVWDEYSDSRVVVWPRGGDLADYSEAWQDYFNVVSAATAVFGLNTTALLEAVVAGRPCITLLSEEYRMAQTATGHFRHLLAGDFMELARNYDEIADAILKIRAGVDVKAQQRRQFRTSFLRPCGPETPASIVVVELLESLARPAPAERLSWSQLRPSRQLPDPMPGLVVSA